MSFADKLRKELAEIPVKSNCCRRAMLAGMLLNAKILPEGKKVLFCARNEIAANAAEELIRLQYGVTPERKKVVFCGRVYENLTFFSPAVAKMVQSFGQANSVPEQAVGFSCNACRSAFLRGAFLDRATVNDPHKSFHLEFLFENPQVATFFASFLEEIGYPPRSIQRSNGTGLYFKESGAVEELIAFSGAHHVIFEVINSRIEREIRNNENRATNCVARNIGKTVAASARQADAIEKLMKSGMLSGLPDSLRRTAELRYTYPDATLSELAGLHEPPITKSGLNHRLEKLVELAGELPERGEEK